MKILCFYSNDSFKDYFEPKFEDIEFVLGDVQDYDNYKDASEVEIITAFTSSKFNKKNIDKFPNLKMISTRSVSHDNIDLEYCKEKEIVVSNAPFYGKNTVAEFTFALILAISRKAFYAYEKVRDDMDFSRRNTEELKGFDLRKKTIGIIGVGGTGRYVAKIANGFGMNIIGYDRGPELEMNDLFGLAYVDLETLLRESDIISIHIPHNKDTHHLINSFNIEKINRGAVLINASEGEIVDTLALKEALDKGILSAAGLDSLEMESEFGRESIDEDKLTKEEKIIKKTNKKLIKMDNVIITPHNGFNTTEAVERIWKYTEGNIKSFLDSDPINLIK